MALYHIIPVGDHPHWSGIVQVIDEDGMNAIMDNFDGDIYITLDHLPHLTDVDTRSYGWVKSIAKRNDGIYANIEWTPIGQDAIDGKLFKYFSPEFKYEDMIDLGDNRYRPTRLSGLSLTNNPNMKKDMKPIFNSAEQSQEIISIVTEIPDEIMNKCKDKELLNEIVDGEEVIDQPSSETTQDQDNTPVTEDSTPETLTPEEIVDVVDEVIDIVTDEIKDIVEEILVTQTTEDTTTEDVQSDQPEQTSTTTTTTDQQPMLNGMIEDLKSVCEDPTMTDADFADYVKSLISEDMKLKKAQKEQETSDLLNSYDIPKVAMNTWKDMVESNKDSAVKLLDVTFAKKSTYKPTPKYTNSTVDKATSTLTNRQMFEQKVAEYQKANNANYTTAFNKIFGDFPNLLA